MSDSDNEKQTIIGPVLPPHLQKNNTGPESESENSTFGPELPPHLKAKAESASIGPVLPPHLQEQDESDIDEPQSIIGPALPPNLRKELANRPTEKYSSEDNSDSEDDCYGPLPEGHSSKSRAQIALEERAIQLKLNQLDPKDDKQPIREEWMLELPAAKAANFGLGPRQFRNKSGPDLSDRSSWTDTPQDKAKKKEGKKEKTEDVRKVAELAEMHKRDKEQEMISKKHKKHKESLLDTHRKKLKKEKHEAGGATERRPFNRETDLQVNRFDEAQKKAVLKKAQLLDNRFSSGQAKFL